MVRSLEHMPRQRYVERSLDDDKRSDCLQRQRAAAFAVGRHQRTAEPWLRTERRQQRLTHKLHQLIDLVWRHKHVEGVRERTDPRWHNAPVENELGLVHPATALRP